MDRLSFWRQSISITVLTRKITANYWYFSTFIYLMGYNSLHTSLNIV